jgi:hypothetical protein
MNNPPAFPSLHWVAPQGHSANENPQGMTLRDYFAARGMETLMTKVVSELERKHHSIKDAQQIQNVYASMCYAMADAMLKAREA